MGRKGLDGTRAWGPRHHREPAHSRGLRETIALGSSQMQVCRYARVCARAHTHTHTHTHPHSILQPESLFTPSKMENMFEWSHAGGSDGKESTCNAGDLGSIPGWGRFPGGGHGNPLQYSCLENSMDRGAWWATVQGVAKSRDTTERLSTVQ